MNKFAKIIVAIIFYLPLSAFAEESSSWNLPIAIDDSNTTINFEVDSTWVLVEGTTSGLSGQIIKSKDNSDKIQTDLSFLVENMKTGLSARDKKLMKIMAVDKYPKINLHLEGFETDCNPKVLEQQESCVLKQKGSLTIKDVSREVDINCLLTKKSDNSGYLANGEITFPWAAFNIDDPSILVAKLYPDVRVVYQVFIAKERAK